MLKRCDDSIKFFLCIICISAASALWGCGGGDGPPGGVDPHPRATVLSPESGRRFPNGEVIHLAGAGYDAEDGTLGGSAMVWVSNLDGEIGTGTAADMESPGPGVHQITLTVTDSDGLSDTASILVTVGNGTPEAFIDEPANGKRFEPGEPIVFRGFASDPEDGALDDSELTWRSDRDGDLGTGAEITVSNLIGTHVITLTAADRDGAKAEESLTIHVGDTFPLARINRPEDHSIFEPGETVLFSGEGEGAREGLLTGNSLIWISNRDGQIGTGPFVTADSLSRGAHTINLVATDSDGKTGSDAIVISIGNSAPKVSILKPLDRTLFDLGETIAFEGRATDVEDGRLPNAELVWSSDRDGRIGVGNAVSTGYLTEGTHTISLAVRDSLGAVAEDSITVWVGRAGPGFNTPPRAEIIAPAESASFQLNEHITFEGEATDDQDGMLSGDSLVWTSNLNGEFGTGRIVITDQLTEGTHTIALSAVDRDGSEGVSSMTIYVGNTPPEVEILSPAQADSFQVGEFITLEGRAVDTEDGVMSGKSLVWSSNLNGRIGTGTSVTTDALFAGEQTITLTATDSLLATASTMIHIRVAINNGPVAMILSPEDNREYELGDSVALLAQAEDSEDGILMGDALVWTSKLAGVTRTLGYGRGLTVNDLGRGVHVLTLTATDSNGQTDQDAITLFVGNAPPNVEITNPIDGTDYDKGNTVIFTAIAEDPEDGALGGESLVWTSSIDDEIGRGANISATSLSEGRHTITLTATDREGISGSDSILITVGNTLPTATIVFPGDRAVYEPGNYVVFTGTGNDLEDGSLSGDSLEWTSSIDGLIGSGSSLRFNTLSEGTHLITLTAFDKDGGAGSAAITIYVGNAEPVATITKPSKISGKTEFYEGEAIEFAGTGFDPEDGILRGEALVWTIDGAVVLGTGERFTTEQLPAGTHTAVLTATDRDGGSDTDYIQIIIIGTY